ncbi:MAG: hypothetical protein WBG09_00325 [Candidatus Sulfotelmatobacter sp.]
MRLRRRPMLPRDAQPCAELVAAHSLESERYGELQEQLSWVWKNCLRSRSLITVVLEDMESGKPSLQGFGVSAFVTDEFTYSCKMPSMRWIGPELVRCLMRGESPVLDPNEIRDANSTGGLNLASWASILCPQNESDRTQVQVELMTAFMQEHSGFKLKEIIGQQNERIMMEVVSNSGGLFWNCAKQRYVEVHNFDVKEVLQHPFILGATPETAREHLSWTTTLFQYTPPRMFPKPTEQRLLSAAIRGLKDEELSCELGVSLSFIKKTWSSIYNRAAETLPELNLDIATGSIPQRGREKKQRVLSYLREHAEELRPISSSKLRL